MDKKTRMIGYNRAETIENGGTAYERRYINGEEQHPPLAMLAVYGAGLYFLYSLARTAFFGYETIIGYSPWLWWSLAVVSVLISLVAFGGWYHEWENKFRSTCYFIVFNALFYGLILFVIGFIANDYELVLEHKLN